MSLLGFLLQNETLILDNLFYLYNVNAARLSYLYESSVGAREALKKTEKDINTCFYRLVVATPTRLRLKHLLKFYIVVVFEIPGAHPRPLMYPPGVLIRAAHLTFSKDKF